MRKSPAFCRVSPATKCFRTRMKTTTEWGRRGEKPFSARFMPSSRQKMSTFAQYKPWAVHFPLCVALIFDHNETLSPGRCAVVRRFRLHRSLAPCGRPQHGHRCRHFAQRFPRRTPAQSRTERPRSRMGGANTRFAQERLPLQRHRFGRRQFRRQLFLQRHAQNESHAPDVQRHGHTSERARQP